MSSYRIDGKRFASEIGRRTQQRIQRLYQHSAVTPGLAVIRVGDDAASEIYVNRKVKQARQLGVHSEAAVLPADASQQRVAGVLQEFADRRDIHGILLQLPLPPHLDAMPLIEAIPPQKDVDGFTSANVAALSQSRRCLVACTPTGSMMLARHAYAKLNGLDDSVAAVDGISLAGLHAVVVGRSQIVGRPLAQLLVHADCTVTIAHSRTRDLAQECARADLLFLAVGRAQMVRGDWVKPGAIVIDVGINRVALPGGDKVGIVGDAHAPSVAEVAGAWTPVPGGVGPMTIACLLSNAVDAAAMQSGCLDKIAAEET